MSGVSGEGMTSMLVPMICKYVVPAKVNWLFLVESLANAKCCVFGIYCLTKCFEVFSELCCGLGAS